MGDELVQLLEGAGVEEEIDALAGGELPGLVLPPNAILNRRYAFTACDFSQSFRNFSRPMLVRGWL